MYKIIHKERILKFIPYSISATVCFLWYFHCVLIIWQPSYQRVHLFKATCILFLSVAWHVSYILFQSLSWSYCLAFCFSVWCFKTFCCIISLCPYCLTLLFMNLVFRVFIFTFSPIISCPIFLLDFLSCYESKISAIATFCKGSKAIMYILSLKVPKP
jgi:hypothetical protein